MVVLGWAYAGNSDDDRNTPSKPLADLIEKTGAEVIIHDPYFSEYKEDLKKVLKGAQAIVLMADHDQYKKIKLTNLRKLMRRSKPIIIDGRNVFSKEKAQKAGFIYKGIGNI